MKIFISILFVLLLSGSVFAEKVDKETEAKIRSSLSVLLPGLVPDEIRSTPVANLFEVTFGGRIVYLTADGRYLLQGKIIDLETRAEITEERLSELKAAALAAIGEDRMVIYGPDDAKDTVTVFTDIDCGYCRKLHSEMARYNEEGIRIRYLFYPRAGVGSDSYKKAVSVWCADDRRAAMDLAKAGKEIPQLDCDNPVEDHYNLGQTIGVTGTPALLLEGGEMVPGYVPAHKLRKALDTRREQTGG
jgi:thiol:disulfide interchange protein DsbC